MFSLKPTGKAQYPIFGQACSIILLLASTYRVKKPAEGVGSMRSLQRKKAHHK